MAFNNLGVVAKKQNDYTEARACCEQSLRICREIGDRYNEGIMLNNLGSMSDEQGEYTRASDYYDIEH
jgi:tetratricopeptide (TPR) repeat protein